MKKNAFVINPKKDTIIIFAAILILSLFSCAEKVDEKYAAEIEDWRNARIERLKQPDSWLSLAGLYWLKEGENSFGSDQSNDFVFPPNKAPGFIGKFLLEDSSVTVKINPGVEIMSDGKKVDELVLRDDQSGNPNVLEYGSLSWYLIKRGEKYGIRLKNSLSPTLTNFKGIKTFPVSERWKVKADLIPYNPPKMIEVPSVIGTVDTEESPGALSFKFEDSEYKLDPLKSGDGYFLIFADKTSGDETYGAGRFLYVEPPDSLGNIYIDFNKAYNPPCAFTRYATCPLPPKDNFLSLAVEAGEKNYKGDH